MESCGLITDRDWHSVEAQFRSTSPYNYAVLDEFLTPVALHEIRNRLVTHKGWRFMNVDGHQRVLIVRNPDAQMLTPLATAVAQRLPNLFRNLTMVEHSAFMNRENVGLQIHSDNGLITVNIFLTPDEFNLEASSGGTILYDVKRGDALALHEFNAQPWCTEYFKRMTRGGQVRIDYRCNRAVIFDARTLHAADRMRFAGGAAASHRINLALRFDHLQDYTSRFDEYRPSQPAFEATSAPSIHK